MVNEKQLRQDLKDLGFDVYIRASGWRGKFRVNAVKNIDGIKIHLSREFKHQDDVIPSLLKIRRIARKL